MSQYKNKKIVTLAVAFLLTLLVAKPLLREGNISVHDDTHPARLMFIRESISNGQFPPIWADEANYTYGYPLLHFYAPAFYYLALVINLMGATYTYAINLAIFMTVFVGAVGMMKLMEKQGYFESILATTSFILLPYLAVNIYVRGSYAELLSISLMPWLFTVWRDLENNTKSIIKTALVTSIFIMSHNLIPLLTAPFLLIWIALHNKRKLKSITIIAVVVTLLSAFFFAPLLTERSFVQAETIAKNTNYNLHFLEPWQLWDSTWGYGGSSPGVSDGMSFKIGKPQLILALVGVYFLIKKKKRANIFFAITALFGAFLTTQYSRFIWEAIEPMQIIQFPWRFLGLIGFAISVIAATALKITKSNLAKLALCILLVLGIVKVNSKYFQPENNFRITDDMIFNTLYIQESLSKKIPEYLPAWMPEQPSEYPTEFVFGNNTAGYEYSEGGGEINLSISLNQAEDIIIAKTYYPTWNITDNAGKNLEFSPSERGFIRLNLNEGENKLILTQSNTKIQRIAGIVSISTLIITAMVLLSSAYKEITQK